MVYNKPISYSEIYCRFLIHYNNCKWYEFLKKKTIKDELDWYYPLMKNELTKNS